MIKYDKNEKIFYLNSINTTYAFGLLKDDILVHLYWGKRIPNNLFSTMMEDFMARNFSARVHGEYSLDTLPLEYATFGNADMRIPALHVHYKDGSHITRLRYKDHTILQGKPNLEGLPATYAEENDNVQTLVICLRDDIKGLDVFLSYTVYEELDVITRSVKIMNHGEDIKLKHALSCMVDFHGVGECDVIHLDGAWARERAIVRNPVSCGNHSIESRYGASSAVHNPFIALCDHDTTEKYGNVYGFSLLYSGNFTAGVELNPYNCARVYMGINPFQFEYVLHSGETFQTPEVVMVYSADGLGGMSRIYHRLYRTRLCRGKYRDSDRLVLINNWEATYFDFTEDTIIDIARKAATIGVDTMVLDDGWFGKRTSDAAGLGDWVENKDRLPNGLKGLAEQINKLGMKFGLWVEPEMVNPDSELYRTHPDWVLHTKGRESSLTRNQLTLDLSRKDVCDYIITTITSVLSSANIEYVKWDMNRYMSEVGSAALPPEQQGEVYHRYILGLYYVLENITQQFPDILFESCAGGGGRFDAGMLYYMPQVWTSDNTDAIERLEIQYGTSIVYPFSAMGAHVSACPNHQMGRTTSFEMRANVAMTGQFGFELDLNKCTEEEISLARKAIEKHREFRSIFHRGDCYRLKSPFNTAWSIIEFISEDKQEILVCLNSKRAKANAVDEYVCLEGLEENENYMLADRIYSGGYLMYRGLPLINGEENYSKILQLHKIQTTRKKGAE